MESRMPTLIVSCALLLIPVAIWAERAYPELWYNRLAAPFGAPEPTVVCVDDVLVVGNSETGYTVIESCP